MQKKILTHPQNYGTDTAHRANMSSTAHMSFLSHALGDLKSMRICS